MTEMDPESLTNVVSDHTLTENNVSHEKTNPEDVFSPPAQLHEEDPDIDKGYAWVVCGACVLFNFCTWGMNSGFAIYFANYLTNGTFEGATKMDYSYIGGMAFGVGVVFSPLITVIQGYIGFKNTLIIGNCLQFTALMLASWSRKLWQLYCTQGLMQSFGLAFLSIPAITVLPQWFKKKRVLAMGLSSAGSGLGGIVFNLGMQKVVDTKGVFWALRVQSIIGFGLTWIAIFLAKSKAAKHNIQFDFFNFSSCKTAGYWLVMLFVITCIFGYVIVLYTLANFTTSLGYSERQGSIVSAMVQVGSLFGRPVVGYLSDRYGAATLGSIVYYISGIFCLAMWIPARNYATVIIFALIMGSIMGSIYAIFAPLIARIFGLQKMSIIFGQIWAIVGVAGLFSPVIGVKLTKGSGAEVNPSSYRDCSIFTGIMFLACATFMLIIRGYIKARDRILVEKGDEVTDMRDAESITVPVGDVLQLVFARSNEKA
ncbi:MCT family MFS transporter [Acetobacter pasteurianus]|nr:MCT family MFS transporter [Acetobacter pasteurianus]